MLDRNEASGDGGIKAGTRRCFLTATAATAGAAVIGTGLLDAAPAVSAPRRSRALDRRILDFALLLEYVQAAFYRDGLKRAGLRGEFREFAQVAGEQDRDHAVLLRRALGARARPEPKFAFGEATRTARRFIQTALLLEDTAVAAYNGQAANLTRASLPAALSIVSVEGRHAAWIRDLAGQDPAPLAADLGKSATEVTAILRKAGLLRRRS